MPWEWWLSCLCEAFACLPSEALAEVARAPAGLLETIVEMRGYARAKARYENARTQSEVGRDRLTQLVKRIDFEIADEDRLAHGPTSDSRS
jgi:hypothetical protein